MATKYTFETHDVVHHHPHHESTKSHRRGHRRTASASSDPSHSDAGGGGDPHDCSGSLTYSAASSINSGCGESTDSSFADIMKVLEIQDGTNLAAYLKGGGGGGGASTMSFSRRDEKSVTAESLAYSTDADTYLRSLATDADSHLHGTELLSQAYAGSAPDRIPPSSGDRDDPANAAGTAPDAFADDIFFAPAEHTESIKQRKERKRQERQQRRASRAQGPTTTGTTATTASTSSTPRTSIHVGTRSSQPPSPVSQPRYSQPLDATDALQWESRQEPTPPPRPPKSRATTTSSRAAAPNAQGRRKGGKAGIDEDYDCHDDDVWYAKWWVFCFPDAVRNMTERR